MSKSAQFRTRSTPSSVLHSPDLPSVACLVLGADRRSVSSVRACVSCIAWSALHLVRPALLPVLCSLSGCAGRCREPPAGYIAAAQPRPVSPVTTEKIKKTHPTFTKRRPSDCASLQKFRKIQKDPSSGLICAILNRKKGAL